MKYTILFLVAFFLNTTGFSQSFQEGNLLVKGGIGISSPYYYTNTESTMPPLSLSLDYAIKDKIGIGGVVGITASKYSIVDNKGEYLAKQGYRLIGGRATYHFWSKEHFDVYLGAMMGYVIPVWRVKYTSPYYTKYPFNKPSYNRFVLAGFVGLNYSVNNNWGVFGEVGYNLSYITGGAYWRIPQIK
ncbi:MAG: outer membrane beta-barrel protein [Bacteroidota bacterium]|jgi:hypothetical protein